MVKKICSTTLGVGAVALGACLFATQSAQAVSQPVCTPKWVNAAHVAPYTSLVQANTTMLQAAIDSCSSAGTASLPALVDLKSNGPISLVQIDTVTLGSNIVIKVEAGFTLQALTYAQALAAHPTQSFPAMFASSKLSNVTITGSGTLDGNGASWWDQFYQNTANGISDNRPKFIDLSGTNLKFGSNFDNFGNQLTASPNVTFPTSGNNAANALKVKNAPKSQVEFESSSSTIIVDGVWIYAPTQKVAPSPAPSPLPSYYAVEPSYYNAGQNIAPNTDGIDLVGVDDTTSTTTTLVQNCLIDTGDDDIAIKSNKPSYYVSYNPNGTPSSTTKTGYSSNSSGGAARNITIQACVFGSGHGLSIGGQETGGVYNMAVNNVYFNGTDYGLRIKSDNTYKDSGVTNGITYKNACMQNVAEPILLSNIYNLATSTASGTPTTSSTFYVNFSGTVPATPPTYPTGSSSTSPWPYPPYILDITFDNIFASNVAWTGSNAPKVANLGEIIGSDMANTANPSLGIPGTNWVDPIGTNIVITNSNIATSGATPFTVNNGTLHLGKNSVLATSTSPEVSGDTNAKGSVVVDQNDSGFGYNGFACNSSYYTIPTQQ